YVQTRLVIEGTPDRTTASHFQPYCSGDCNGNLNGAKIISLGAGNHTITLQWRTAQGTITWSSDPNWCDGFCGARKLVVMAYYQ
ncbi:MAG: hypothetical protein N2203_07905, partial [Bacteroidia bacterium]|nr:hypothetical protein [Bacteroidia bacterium]